MNSSSESRRGCTIVVDMKAASNIDPSVQAATTLAAAVGAEVLGLFIQEDAMIDLAGLPFAQALNVGGGPPKSLSPETMLEAFNRHATLSRRILSAQAEKDRVNWSFSAERGDLRDRLYATVAGGDYLVLAGNGRGFGTHHLIDELRACPPGARGVVVTTHHRTSSAVGPVIAIDDGDETGKGTVALATRIADVTGSPFMLFVIAENDAEADRITQRAKQITPRNLTIINHRFIPGASQTIASALTEMAPRFVVGYLEGTPFGDDNVALALFRAARAPVVLLRPNGANASCNHSTEYQQWSE